MQSLSSILLSIEAQLETESALRESIKESVKDLDKEARSLVSLANRAHSTPASQLPALADALTEALIATRPAIAAIVALIPEGELYRWQATYQRALQQLVFVAALSEFLRSQQLVELPTIGSLLQIDPSSTRLTLQPEDYLHGVISLVNELSRLAVNSVTLENYTFPLQISAFVSSLFAGYQLLNLRNDSLRRRFDSLKYDLKKIEEVVYDIKLRGLIPAATGMSEDASMAP